MNWPLYVGIAAVIVAAAVGFWWHRRRRRTRLISFVALVREPVPGIDPTVLARLASKAWNADLGDGGSEGPDGFVVGVGPMNTIMFRGRMFLINIFPTPYVNDLEAVAQSIPDQRLRASFLEHTAWFSCDAMGVDGRTPEHEVTEWYRLLGRLFAELLDDNCLVIFLPDRQLAYPINEDTEAALRSDDPPGELQATLTVPIIEVAADDPLMLEAVARARREWPKFVAAFEREAGGNFSIKAPVSHGGNTEFIWIAVRSIEGERVYGELGNEPGNLGPLRLGSKVSVLAADLNDWCYMDPSGKLTGGFTIEAVQKASQKASRRNSSR